MNFSLQTLIKIAVDDGFLKTKYSKTWYTLPYLSRVNHKIKNYSAKANFKAETIHPNEEPIHEKTKINALKSKKSINQ